MSVSVVAIPLSSPLFPLPSDYGELTPEGQRLARINASRQWLVPTRDPVERRLRAVASHNFFDLTYLHPTDQDDPGFYPTVPLPRPLFHDQMVGEWHLYNRTAQVYPRGSGKTKRCQADMIHRNVTCPAYSFVYATASDELAHGTGDACKNQFYSNTRLNDDFGPEPEFGGEIKPTRGDRPTGVELMFLNNGSYLKCISAASKQRGIRPRKYRLDDPEWDPTASTSMTSLRENLHRLIFKIVIPAVLQTGCGVDWTGTYISKRHLLWQAMLVKDTPTGPRAEDPRFDYWARTSMFAGEETGEIEDGKPVFRSAWPEMWPGSMREKLALGLPEDVLTLGQLREVVGVHVFNPEFLGRPGDEGTAYFPVLTEDSHGYSLSSLDSNFESDPRHSTTLVTWKRKEKGELAPVSMQLQELLSRSRLFMCLDHADTSHAGSDSKTVCLFAHLPTTNELFLLDLYSSQRDRSEQVKTAFEWADRWKCPLLAPEVVKSGVVLYTDLTDKAHTRAHDSTGDAFIPRISAIRPGMELKTEKIASLVIRVEHGLLKLPWHLRAQHPWNRLHQQFAEFNPLADNGGLQKDDEIDTVAMSKFVLKSRSRDPLPPTAKPHDATSLLATSPYLPGTTIPIAHGMNIHEIPIDAMARHLNPSSVEGDPETLA